MRQSICANIHVCADSLREKWDDLGSCCLQSFPWCIFLPLTPVSKSSHWQHLSSVIALTFLYGSKSLLVYCHSLEPINCLKTSNSISFPLIWDFFVSFFKVLNALIILLIKLFFFFSEFGDHLLFLSLASSSKALSPFFIYVSLSVRIHRATRLSSFRGFHRTNLCHNTYTKLT